MQNGRQPPKATEPALKPLDLGPRQRQIVEQIKHDQGYLASLEEEMRAVKERLAANKGKLDLIMELAQEFGTVREEQPAPVAETA